jgi:UDP-glucuronate decarboxylase
MPLHGNREVTAIAREFERDFARRTVLVTGGAGFLGSWLCDVLAESGAAVTCLDNFSTGKMENIEHLKERIKILVGNVEDSRLGPDYDLVFHFSSRASPEEYQLHPVETLTANSLGTFKMLELARARGAVFVYASSSEVYGDARVVPSPESYYGNVNPIGVRSCYDEGKRFSEALCMAYSKQMGVDVRLARIFNTYGARIREDGIYARALPRFVSQALRGKPITIFGDGRQTRSFTYVTDTLRGILKLGALPGLKGSVFNIGNPQEVAILELAEEVLRLTHSRSRMNFLPAKPDDPRRRCPDIRKAMTQLGWAPSISLKEGLPKVIEWLREKPE